MRANSHRAAMILVVGLSASAALAEVSPTPAPEPVARAYLWGPLFDISVKGVGMAVDARVPEYQLGFGLMYGGWPTISVPSWALDKANSKTLQIKSMDFRYRRVEAYGRWHPFSYPACRGFYIGPGLERRTMNGDAELVFIDKDTKEKTSGGYSVDVTTWFLGNKLGILHNFHSGFVIGTELNYRYALTTDVTVNAHGNAILSPVAREAIEYVVEEYGVSGGFNWTVVRLGWYF